MATTITIFVVTQAERQHTINPFHQTYIVSAVETLDCVIDTYCKFTITQSRVATALYESIYRLVLITHQSWGPVAGAIAGKCRSGILGPRSSTMGSTLGPRSRHPCALINPHQPPSTMTKSPSLPRMRPTF